MAILRDERLTCPDCDSTCFLPAGPKELVCHHCFLLEKIAAAEAERDRLKADLTDELSAHAEDRRELERLVPFVEAMRKHGRHEIGCARYHGWANECNCGLESVLSAYDAGKGNNG
jgi:hypothetical protein